jgi:hypothetical protein
MRVDSESLKNLGLRIPHPRPLLLRNVIVSQQVQHPVDDQQLQFRLDIVTGLGSLDLSPLK